MHKKKSKQKFQKSFPRDVKTNLIILSLLNGKKYNQTQIKNNVNHMIDHPIKHFKDELLGWNNELEQGILINGGQINDSTVSRIIKDLKKLDIITKESVQIGQGAASSCIQLKEDLDSLLLILTKFNKPFGSNFSFVWLGTKLIKSNYGSKLINKELIENFNLKSGNSLTKNEKEKLLQLIKISPTALKIFLINYSIVKQKQSEWDKYQLFTRIILSLLSDFKLIGLGNLNLSVNISLNFDKNSLRDAEPYKINNNRIDINLY